MRAGEAGGTLADVLARLADYLARAERFRDELASALIYPATLVAMVVVSLIVLLGIVVPQFEALFAEAGASLPLPTQLVMALGRGLASWGWAVALSVAVLVLLLGQASRSRGFKVARDRRLLKLPWVGEVLTRIETARLARTLGTLVANGVPMVSALGISRDAVANAAPQDALQRVERGIKEGGSLSRLIAEPERFLVLACRFAAIGEESGDLAAMLLTVADIHDEEVQRSVGRFMTVLVPALTLGLGLVIGGIIASILVAILQVNELAI